MIDADDRYHERLPAAFESSPAEWVLPGAILPEVDDLLLHHVGIEAQLAFADDLAGGRWEIEWGQDADPVRAAELCRRYGALRIGLVDGVVMSVAERPGARSIATLDERHFGAVRLAREVRLIPRDLAPV